MAIPDWSSHKKHTITIKGENSGTSHCVCLGGQSEGWLIGVWKIWMATMKSRPQKLLKRAVAGAEPCFQLLGTGQGQKLLEPSRRSGIKTQRGRRKCQGQEDIINRESEPHNQVWGQRWRVWFLNYKNQTSSIGVSLKGRIHNILTDCWPVAIIVKIKTCYNMILLTWVSLIITDLSIFLFIHSFILQILIEFLQCVSTSVCEG